jgi:hypothetical protein
MRGSAVALSFWPRRWRAEMADPQAPGPPADLVRRIVEHLQAAAGAASAAEACVKAGNTEQALARLRDIESPLYEVTTLLNAASLLRGDHAG